VIGIIVMKLENIKLQLKKIIAESTGCFVEITSRNSIKIGIIFQV